jgi:hypothetical protein
LDEVRDQFRIELLRVAPGLVQGRLCVRKGFGVVLLCLIELGQAVIRIEFVRECFSQALTESFGLLPLSIADEIIGLVAAFVQILYLPAVKEPKHVVFVPDPERLEKFFRSIKSMACPFCEHIGSLNRHSRLYGNDPKENQGRVLRGQRARCSDRGQRGGCGRTFPVLFAWVLPRHSFTAPLVWQTVKRWLDGLSVGASWQPGKTPLLLGSFYHLIQRLRGRLSMLRTVLSEIRRAPESRRSDPLLQTFEHLCVAFPQTSCPIAAFQERFQKPWTG